MTILFTHADEVINDISAYLKADPGLSTFNFYTNEIVFLQEYELPAILLYSSKNYPSNDRDRTTLGDHERIIEFRVELRGSVTNPMNYPTVADTIYKDLLLYKAEKKTLKYVGNPTYQIGLDEKQPNEVAATLDVPLVYQGRP